MEIVIIGHGPAGMTATGFAQRTNRKARITVLEKRSYDIFHPCAMPYVIATEDRHVDDIRESVSYGKAVNYLGSSVVTRIDAEKKTVNYNHSDQEETINYDKLIIATGSIPTIPTRFIKGWDKEKVFVLGNLDDASRIKAEVDKGAKRAVIVGGSAIGLELASELAHRGLSITLFELLPQVLPGKLDKDMAEIVQKYLMEQGIGVFTGTSVKEILGDHTATGITTGDMEVEADFVVMCTGVRPELDFLKESTMELETGTMGAIVVNERMETNIKDIYAAGDCVLTKNLITGKLMNAMLAGIATRQGRIAGINAAGGNERFPSPGIPTAWIVPCVGLTFGATGISTEIADKEGIKVKSARLTTEASPHYMPQTRIVTVKLIADVSTEKLVGLQAVGYPTDIAAFVDYATMIMINNMSIRDIPKIDFCYAPATNECMNPIVKTNESLLRRMR
ncbi:MAG: FAD-dependent oxidoreductase [Candidatus Hodarchaeales archaeon]|jgi:NADH oxidase (H2O2-forming)